MKVVQPVRLILFLTVLVSLACGSGSILATETPIPPTDTPAPPPTETKNPTATKIPVTSTPKVQKFYTETFQGDLSNWGYFLRSGDPDKFFLETIEDGLQFELTGTGIFSYVYYDAFEYEAARIEAVVENRGVNDNNITLFCRYSEDDGWYELNVYSSGLYDIYFTKPDSAGNLNYGLIANGGSNKINQGLAVNKYALECLKDKFVVYINDVETKTASMPSYVLDSGKVGISVSSFGQVPVKVVVQEFTISEPK